MVWPWCGQPSEARIEDGYKEQNINIKNVFNKYFPIMHIFPASIMHKSYDFGEWNQFNLKYRRRSFKTFKSKPQIMTWPISKL